MVTRCYSSTLRHVQTPSQDAEAHVESSRRIGPVHIEVRTLDAAITEVIGSVDERAGRLFGFCNAHTVNLARSSSEFARTLGGMCLFNDGIGVELASRLLHAQPFPVNLNGTDFTPAVLGRLRPGTRVYLLGSTADVAASATRLLSDRFPQLVLCGHNHGFFAPEQESAVAEHIARLAPDLILVGMGQPRQEFWAVKHGPSTGATLLCVGAYLDFAAGRFTRAPAAMRQLRVEWLFRLFLEPRRLWKRYVIGNTTFLLHVLRLRVLGNVDNSV